jgi:hypothetical protein
MKSIYGIMKKERIFYNKFGNFAPEKLDKLQKKIFQKFIRIDFLIAQFWF